MIRSEKIILSKTDEIAKWISDSTAIYNQTLYYLRQEYFDSQKKKQMLCLCLPGLLVLGRATARTDFPADKDPVPISRVSYCPPSCLFSASSEAAMTVRQTIDFDMLLFGRLEQNFLPAPTLARRLFFASS